MNFFCRISMIPQPRTSNNIFNNERHETYLTFGFWARKSVTVTWHMVPQQRLPAGEHLWRHLHETLSIFRSMRESPYRPNSIVYSQVVFDCRFFDFTYEYEDYLTIGGWKQIDIDFDLFNWCKMKSIKLENYTTKMIIFYHTVAHTWSVTVK